MIETLRTKAVHAIADLTHAQAPVYQVAPQDFFADRVFNDQVMQTMLDGPTYAAVHEAKADGHILDNRIADIVARAMRDWAMQRGATHYAHVFYPLTGLTAEKHDAFIEPAPNGAGVIANFGAKQLIRGEADGSSLPSGGLRATFEARGYTAWDVTSPAYLLENAGVMTLFIPTAFFASNGAALDKKTPLLRANQAVTKQAKRVLAALGETDQHVKTCAGCEQEYFLIDRHFYLARPDLISAGRTLFGAKPPKGQEMEDQYYGAIQERVLAFMVCVERELLHLGVPCKTRHNEVAPGQFEIAPIYEETNIASDHQQLVMSVLQRIALRHGFACLLHEKPFAGVNGSGKHVNWSIATETENLLSPSSKPEKNLHFLLFCSAVIAATNKHAALLRSSIAHAGNDHRLGACEAPPAIISIFLGDRLTRVFEDIARGEFSDTPKSAKLSVGIDFIAPVSVSEGDRNRTSPFAFTGNKFEFRAVGSSQAVAGPLMILNTIIAQALSSIADDLEKLVEEGLDNESAVYQLVGKLWRENSQIVFNGDNYAAAWIDEATRRGLPNLTESVAAIDALVAPDAIETMIKMGVLSEREVRARHEIYLERYVKDIAVEARLTAEMGRTVIMPAVMSDLQNRSQTILNLKALSLPVDTSTITKLSTNTAALHSQLDTLEQSMDQTPTSDSATRARYMRDTVIPAMNTVRSTVDTLEAFASDQLWPLPTYQEMLFVR